MADPAASNVLPADTDLIRRLRAGDEAAYESLVRSLTPRLRAVARRITRTDADADDVVQEAFLSAFKALATFDGRSALSTWLHRIVVNAALMRARKDKVRASHESSIESLLPRFEAGEHQHSPARWRPVTSDDAISIEERRAIYSALDRLPDEFRTVLVLKDIEGMESKAIAASLGVSDALVRQRLHRARQALLALLDPILKENGA